MKFLSLPQKDKMSGLYQIESKIQPIKKTFKNTNYTVQSKLEEIFKN